MFGHQPGKAFCIASVIVLVVMLSAPPGNARSADTGASTGMTFGYSRDPDTLILAYTLNLGEIGEADRGPTLRVYGDGFTYVHYPVYMTRFGDYGLQLSEREMDQLLASLLSDGLLTFDATQTRAALDLADRMLKDSTGQLYHVSDPSTTIIELHLTEADAPGLSAPLSMGADRVISWSGLHPDAQRHTGNTALQGLASAVRTLHTLMERPDLLRIDPASLPPDVTAGD